MPPIEARLRALIRQMSMDNPLWGAPRVHGELLKLGFEVAQSSVAKYIVVFGEAHLRRILRCYARVVRAFGAHGQQRTHAPQQ
jgi:hypothetical protein